jgi:hypothetical protein
MLWILINIRPHVRPHNIDLIRLLWDVRAPARILCFLCVLERYFWRYMRLLGARNK